MLNKDLSIEQKQIVDDICDIVQEYDLESYGVAKYCVQSYLKSTNSTIVIEEAKPQIALSVKKCVERIDNLIDKICVMVGFDKFSAGYLSRLVLNNPKMCKFLLSYRDIDIIESFKNLKGEGEEKITKFLTAMDVEFDIQEYCKNNPLFI